MIFYNYHLKFDNIKFLFIAEIPEYPTKCIVLNRTVQVVCNVQYIDFEGRSDGESLMKILHQLKPRRVIVVRGSEENTSLMVKQCNTIGARVFAPKKLEMVDATSETHIYQVRYYFLRPHIEIFFKDEAYLFFISIGACFRSIFYYVSPTSNVSLICVPTTVFSDLQVTSRKIKR